MDFIDMESLDVEWGEVYEGTIEAWVRDEPNKTVLNLRGREEDIIDEDFALLKGVGLKHLDITGCPLITDRAFANLGGGLITLVMAGCDQLELTDAAFTYLRGIKTLDISACRQSSLLPFRRGIRFKC